MYNIQYSHLLFDSATLSIFFPKIKFFKVPHNKKNPLLQKIFMATFLNRIEMRSKNWAIFFFKIRTLPKKVNIECYIQDSRHNYRNSIRYKNLQWHGEVVFLSICTYLIYLDTFTNKCIAFTINSGKLIVNLNKSKLTSKEKTCKVFVMRSIFLKTYSRNDSWFLSLLSARKLKKVQ